MRRGSAHFRVLMFWVAVAVPAACVNSNVPVGKQCSSSGQCPDNQECDQSDNTCKRPEDIVDASLVDASIDARCAFGAWGNVEQLTDLAGDFGQFAPHISPDGLRLYWDETVAVDKREIHWARRPDRISGFVRQEGDDALTINDTAVKVIDAAPALTRDGKTIYFSSSRSGNGDADPTNDKFRDIWYATRANIDAPFDTPLKLQANISSDNVYEAHPHFADGVLYFTRRGSVDDLFMAVQGAGPDDFAPPVALPASINQAASGETSSFVSRDGLELYFASDRDADGSIGGIDIWHTTRATTDVAFDATIRNVGPPINTAANDSGVSITEDGKELFYVSNVEGNPNKLYRATRTHNCP